MEKPNAYDYRMYDQVWKRVSPQLDPYPDIHSVQTDEQHIPDTIPTLPSSSALSMPPQTAATEEAALPGAQLNPCCMGSEAMESIQVLEGFIEEELAQRRCYLALSNKMRHSGASQLLRTLAADKLSAAQELKTTYFLITGSCYENIISIDHMRWNSLCDALRSCYHQEACNGFNYQRASEETVDSCLKKILSHLSSKAFARADAVMELLGHML